MITPMTITSLDQGKIFDRASLEPRDEDAAALAPAPRPSRIARTQGWIGHLVLLPIAMIQTLLVISRS